MIRAGGRIRNSEASYDQKHPVIIRGDRTLSKLIIRNEHVRLLHAGPIRTLTSLSDRFHVIGGLKAIRSVTRSCVICRRRNVRPTPQMVGQLPKERVIPGHVFDHVGVDYAGPLQLKLGKVRRPTIVKVYVCIFVSMSVKAVHLEPVTDLTTEAFISSLKRFVARRGLPTVIHSDNGTNFVGANHELERWYSFLQKEDTQIDINNFCSTKRIVWKFIPEHAPHFGGLWESALKSMKAHLRKIVGTVKLTYEELTTVLTQVEASLNSRPLVPLTTGNREGIEALTPGHFLIGKSLCSIPEPILVPSNNLHKRWHMCQCLTQHFWRRWSSEYLNTLRKFYKWNRPRENLKVGDVVVLREDGMAVNHWPLGRIEEVFPGNDGLVRTAIVKTSKGVYKRPVVKISRLMEELL